jgi:hypothetical protein
MKMYILSLCSLALAAPVYAATPTPLKDTIKQVSRQYDDAMRGISCKRLAAEDRLRYDDATRAGQNLLFIQSGNIKGDPYTIAVYDDARHRTIIVSVRNVETEASVYRGKILDRYPSVCGSSVVAFESLNSHFLLNHSEDDASPVPSRKESILADIDDERHELEARLKRARHDETPSLDLLEVFQDHTGRQPGMFIKDDILDAYFDGSQVLHAGNTNPHKRERADARYRETLKTAYDILRHESARHIDLRKAASKMIREKRIVRR